MNAVTPPSFTEEELDALLLGLCWAMDDEEPAVAIAASSATEKITALIPQPPPLEAVCPTPEADDRTGKLYVPFLEAAAVSECKLDLVYRDKTGAGSSRIIWPLMLDSWRQPEVIVAWCEARRDFRVFRVDRIESFTALDRYPVRRQVLMAKWQLREDDEN